MKNVKFNGRKEALIFVVLVIGLALLYALVWTYCYAPLAFFITLFSLLFFIDFLKKIYCRHDYVFEREVNGDECFMSGKFKRSWWVCKNCGKRKSSIHHNKLVE